MGWKCKHCGNTCLNPSLPMCPSCQEPKVPLKTCWKCKRQSRNPKDTACYYCHTSFRKPRLPPILEVSTTSKPEPKADGWWSKGSDGSERQSGVWNDRTNWWEQQPQQSDGSEGKRGDWTDADWSRTNWWEQQPQQSDGSEGKRGDWSYADGSRTNWWEQQPQQSDGSEGKRGDWSDADWSDADCSDADWKVSEVPVTSLPLFDAKPEFGLRGEMLGKDNENFEYLAEAGEGSVLELQLQKERQLIIKGGAQHSFAVEEAKQLIATLTDRYKRWVEKASEKNDDDDAASTISTLAPSTVAPSTVAVGHTLSSFLACLGPEFDAAFVAEHSGAENYEELINFTFQRSDLDDLVRAGMKPLHRNKLFQAIQKEQASK